MSEDREHLIEVRLDGLEKTVQSILDAISVFYEAGCRATREAPEAGVIGAIFDAGRDRALRELGLSTPAERPRKSQHLRRVQ